MNTRAIFGLSALAFFISSVVVAWLFAWPWLRTVWQMAAQLSWLDHADVKADFRAQVEH